MTGTAPLAHARALCRQAKITETSVAPPAYSPLQSVRNLDQGLNLQRLKRRVDLWVRQ